MQVSIADSWISSTHQTHFGERQLTEPCWPLSATYWPLHCDLERLRNAYLAKQQDMRDNPRGWQ
ncbi:MAG: hypothetical protein GY764_00490 [Halieaceae bacterium]|nr:hypothetical protein [Halieaceae bacterium]MCP4468747.1 hypothetical protein [Halieaceae bacterium]MCP4840889.1 hypothetical protein [Halieaceae bacterium]MDG2410199.1 hypothetical protein [Halioglobus sp.]